jgi:hypothetical protein
MVSQEWFFLDVSFQLSRARLVPPALREKFEYRCIVAATLEKFAGQIPNLAMRAGSFVLGMGIGPRCDSVANGLGAWREIGEASSALIIDRSACVLPPVAKRVY